MGYLVSFNAWMKSQSSLHMLRDIARTHDDRMRSSRAADKTEYIWKATTSPFRGLDDVQKTVAFLSHVASSGGILVVASQLRHLKNHLHTCKSPTRAR